MGPFPQIITGNQNQTGQKNSAGKHHHRPYLVALPYGLRSHMVCAATSSPLALSRLLLSGRSGSAPLSRSFLLRRRRCFFSCQKSHSVPSFPSKQASVPVLALKGTACKNVLPHNVFDNSENHCNAADDQGVVGENFKPVCGDDPS